MTDKTKTDGDAAQKGAASKASISENNPQRQQKGAAKSVAAPKAPPAGVVVICHARDGRRRAGRRWGHGQTPVADGVLSARELAALEADPLFTVQRPES